MKKCSKIRKLFGSYLYDGVTPDERAAVEEHIRSCEMCSAELESFRKLMGEVRLDSESDDIPQRSQEDFASSVYRGIASDVLRKRSRQIFLRRSVLQPSLAAVAVAALIAAIGVFLYPGAITVDETSPSAIVADETSTKERKAFYVEEFFRSQGAPYEREARYTAVETASANENPSSDVDRLMQDRPLPESQRLLEEADFINYSLGDRRRALAIYQWVVDSYPDTDAAMRARGRIGSISDREYNVRVERVDLRRTVDRGI